MINIQLDDELRVANYVIVFHIQNRGKNVTDLTNLLDHYSLHYLPFSPPSFCPPFTSPFYFRFLSSPICLSCLSSPSSVSSLFL